MGFTVANTDISQEHVAAFNRVADVPGVVFAVLLIVSQLLVSDMPTAADDAQAIREYFNDNVGAHRTALVLVGAAIAPRLLFSRDVELSDGILLALWDINMEATPMMVLGFGMATTCAAISAMTTASRPDWHSGLGILVGLASAIGVAGLAADSDSAAAVFFVMFPLFMIWTIGATVLMYRDA